MFLKQFAFDGMKSAYRFYNAISRVTINKRENANLSGHMSFKEQKDKEAF